MLLFYQFFNSEYIMLISCWYGSHGKWGFCLFTYERRLNNLCANVSNVHCCIVKVDAISDFLYSYFSLTTTGYCRRVCILNLVRILSLLNLSNLHIYIVFMPMYLLCILCYPWIKSMLYWLADSIYVFIKLTPTKSYLPDLIVCYI